MTRTIFSWRSSPKNMCSVRHRPMPSAPSSRARRASSGVSAFARTPRRRSSSAQPRTVRNSSVISGSTSGTSSVVTDARRAVDREQVALVQDEVADAHAAPREVDCTLAGAGHGRHAHPARHERRVRGLAALAGQDALGRVEAGDVVGLGERAHEDDVAAVRRRGHRLGGGEDDPALGRPRRRRHAARP